MKKQNVILIHGWGTTWQSLYPLFAGLKDKYDVFTPNLPYPTNKVLTLDDYCQFILDFISQNKIDKPILIGHSLGGAISTKIATNHPKLISKIILLSAASVRHELPPYIKFFQKFGKLLHPFRQQILKLMKLDASDYIVLKTEIEKQTFRNLIHADQRESLSSIHIPTLILWGDNDQSTPLSDGQLIHQLIHQSTFKSYPNTGHFFYLTYPNDVIQDIIKFIK
ncbi:MAG: alpha/beta hydrolase [Microgenomates group bacterium]